MAQIDIPVGEQRATVSTALKLLQGVGPCLNLVDIRRLPGLKNISQVTHAFELTRYQPVALLHDIAAHLPDRIPGKSLQRFEGASKAQTIHENQKPAQPAPSP